MLNKYFIYDLHQDTNTYFQHLKSAVVKKGYIKDARLIFSGNYTFGYPNIIKSNEGEIVPGILVSFFDKKIEKEFIRLIMQTRKMKKVKCMVCINGKNEQAITFVLCDVLREENPLIDLFTKMKEIYNENEFDLKVLKIALKRVIKPYTTDL